MKPIVQLAPMLGLIDSTLINAFALIGGFDEIFMPYMLADNRSIPKSAVLGHRFDGISNKKLIVPQLLGTDANAVCKISDMLFDLGYTKVSWNMGCPQPFVTKHGRGAAMLLNLDATARLIDAVLPRLKPQLSIKTRLGYHSPDEFADVIKMFNKFCINEIVVHARTAVQMYDGKADKQLFAEVARLSVNKVVYNGDIVFADDVASLSFPQLKGYMIGRGALINPLIGKQMHGVVTPPSEQKRLFRQLCASVTDSYAATGGRGCINRLKELWKYFAQAFSLPDEVLVRLMAVSNIDTFRLATEEIFSNFELVCANGGIRTSGTNCPSTRRSQS